MKQVIINNNTSLITDTYTHLVGRTMTNLHLDSEQISGGKFDEVTFKNVTFFNCNFQASAFNSTNFIDCTFVNCNFSFTKFKNCTLIACVFENCNFCITNSLSSNFQACTFQNTSWKLGAFRDNRVIACLLDEQTVTHIEENGENENIDSLSLLDIPAHEELAMAA
jgi:uncharacterized protein YjbI with pentapeptide repeats